MNASGLDVGSLKLSRPGIIRRLMRSRFLVALFVPATATCTPLGLWMYEDPAVTVARVRVGEDSLASGPVTVALDLQNPNDYPLAATHVVLSLALDDHPIGSLEQASNVDIPQGTTSTVALPLEVRSGVAVRNLVGFGSGTHRFLITGEAEFKTPFGTRQVRFAQEGDLRFETPSSPASAPPGPNG
jgi:LEA14-like dessication related protein